jgi:hypothetical protein
MGNSIYGRWPSFALTFVKKEMKTGKYEKSILSDDLIKCASCEIKYRELLVLKIRRHLEGKDLSSSELKEYIKYSICFQEDAYKIRGIPFEKEYKESIKEDCMTKFELSQIETECHMLDSIYGMIQAEVIYDILNNPKLLERKLEDCADDITKAIKESKINMRDLQLKTTELANVSKPAIQNWRNWSIFP